MFRTFALSSPFPIKHFIFPGRTLCTMATKTKKALIVLTEGAEEMELVITADVLRRAEITTVIAGLNSADLTKCSRGIIIKPDAQLIEVNPDEFDAFILPGGLNAANTFAQDQRIGGILKKFEQSNKVIGLICASVIALAKHNVGAQKKITSHPTVSSQLKTGYKYCEDRVCNDGGLITSRGPGTAFDFVLEIVRHLLGEQKVKEITAPMILAQ